MGKKACIDCEKPLTGHGTPERCRPCAARARYVKRFGAPPKRIIAKCEVCDREFSDYETNRKKKKHGVLFCSPECRAAWTGVHNSISRGGSGGGTPKAEKDALHYRSNSEYIRAKRASYYKANREAILSSKKEADRQLKREIIAAYGGACECCGESHLEFLTIDHVNGDGAAHRRELGKKAKGRHFYREIKRIGFPKDRFRLLCFNCNIARGFYGYCPHRPEEKSTVSHVAFKPGRKRKVV